MKFLSPWFCRLVLFLSLFAMALLPQANGAYDFVNTGVMSNARSGHTATLLSNGKVLVAGVDNGASAELYDPATGLWSATGSMLTARSGFTATLLADGKVLVAGGIDLNNKYNFQLSLTSAELYDPVTGLWSATGGMSQARQQHTATLLADGKVLVAGGMGYGWNGSSFIGRAELFDPATGLWSTTGMMMTARKYHTSTLLTNGKVIVAGGSNTFNETLSSVELYDPESGLWSSIAFMGSARRNHTATLLANGKVLVAGSLGNTGEISAEQYNPVSGLWKATGSMISARGNHTATFLVNGKVLVTGGENYYGTSSSAELYDPASELWSAIAAMGSARRNHTATLLPNGMVLVTGGSGVNSDLSSSELNESPGGDFFYSVFNGTITINAYRGAGGALTIPGTIEGFPVTTIGDNAFYGYTNLTSVTIPASVTSIGNQAFSGCSGLSSVNLPESFLTDIEYIGLTGQVAANTLIQGVANNLGGNSAFITDFTNTVLSRNGNYGLSTKTDLNNAVAPLASKADLEPLATKMELSTSLAPLATKTELNSGIAPLATKEELTSTVTAATAPLATKMELSTGLAPLATKTELGNSIAPLATEEELISTVTDATAPLATKTELASQIDALAQNPEFVAALAKNQAFLTALANQISAGPNQYGIAIKQNQTLLFPVIPTQTYRLNRTLRLSATSSAKLTPITYSSSNLSVATISGNIVTLKGKGSTTITASQVGNGQYNQASTEQVLTVK
jgi:hypothetical protein